MNQMSRLAMKSMSIPILDAMVVTQSMWESSNDGLHYMSGHQSDVWKGHTGSFVFQVALNTIFPTCGLVLDL
jgi:hypothetical protein